MSLLLIDLYILERVRICTDLEAPRIWKKEIDTHIRKIESVHCNIICT